ncbi:MAG TPA: urease accessory protein UreE [Rhodospirillaceae bacterium]|nr:urease accessory protein UreE [Rhodospirillaceae bacterium]MAX64690.1 urease accessory protein UreE [Rhodospirillaceae bacterium]MBB58662.1 urease accessory protein UreE [Rhodospirillaceae bacterium]HAE01134.1 urease accessory protein UreE [Rhodospirillaceae bacterium]HAJ20952.1 urease accessory protein UreE [Rhodospirillaceae bacterium]
MRRATERHMAGSWVDDGTAVTATLDLDQRNRRRLKLQDDQGQAFLLDLPKAVTLRQGDGLELQDGGMIRIVEAPEPVADALGVSPAATARLAWHLGNRHLPVQILDDGTIRFRADAVIEAMVEGLGAVVKRHDAPFTPEAGAYDAANTGHGHHHNEGHDHDHDHHHDHHHTAARIGS